MLYFSLLGILDCSNIPKYSEKIFLTFVLEGFLGWGFAVWKGPARHSGSVPIIAFFCLFAFVFCSALV